MNCLSVEVLRATFAHTERVRVMKHHEEKCAGRRSPIDPAALARVRKNLFSESEGTAQPNAVFVEQELRRIESIEKERWNFDFANEKPIQDARSVYKWEAYVKPQAKQIVAPKPRRIGQGKITDYLQKRKGLKRGSDGKAVAQRQQPHPALNLQLE